MRSAEDIIDKCVAARSCDGMILCGEALIQILTENGYSIVPKEAPYAAAMTKLDGELQIDGQTVKWDRNSVTGLAIEFDHGERFHIGGEPTEERVRLAIHAYRAGRNIGLGIGRDQVQAELRKVAGL